MDFLTQMKRIPAVSETARPLLLVSRIDEDFFTIDEHSPTYVRISKDLVGKGDIISTLLIL